MESMGGTARGLMSAGITLALAIGGLVVVAPAAHAETITLDLNCDVAHDGQTTSIRVTQGDTLVIDGRVTAGQECSGALNIAPPFSSEIVDPPGYVESPLNVFTFEILNIQPEPTSASDSRPLVLATGTTLTSRSWPRLPTPLLAPINRQQMRSSRWASPPADRASMYSMVT
jgi:hypothetical protein